MRPAVAMGTGSRGDVGRSGHPSQASVPSICAYGSQGLMASRGLNGPRTELLRIPVLTSACSENTPNKVCPGLLCTLLRGPCWGSAVLLLIQWPETSQALPPPLAPIQRAGPSPGQPTAHSSSWAVGWWESLMETLLPLSLGAPSPPRCAQPTVSFTAGQLWGTKGCRTPWGTDCGHLLGLGHTCSPPPSGTPTGIPP